MQRLNSVSCGCQPLFHLLGDEHRAMLAAGASKSDGEIAFTFLDVVRQEILHQICCPIEKLGRFRKITNVFCDFWNFYRQLQEFRDEVGIGKKSEIEDKIRLGRNSIL